MSIQQVLAVIKQGNSASFPNQQAQRVFTNLRRNPRNSMEQINKAASLADQYLQNQVAGNKEFLKGQNIPMMKAPPVDGGVNIASSQIAGKVPPDQAELVATGQGSVLQKRDLQNAGISSGGSSTNNLSSTNIATNETSAQRFLQTERDEIASQLGEQGEAITPTRIELELANRLGSDAYLYGPKYTRRKHALQVGASYEPKLFNRLSVPSVQIAGQSIPFTPPQGSALSVRTPTVTESTALNLKGSVDQQKDFLGKVRLEATSNMRALEAQAKPLTQALQQAKNRKDFATVDKLDIELNKLRGAYQTQQRRIEKAEIKVTENISNLGLPLKLTPGIETGQRIYAEVDPTGGRGGRVRTTSIDSAGVADDMADDIVTDFDISGTPVYKEGTLELRPERIAVDLPKKGGGGRNVADYTGGGITDEAVTQIQTGGILSTPQRTRQTLGRYRNYDPGTDELNQGGGAPLPPFRNDSALTGNVKDVYGTRTVRIDPNTGEDILRDNPENRPTAGISIDPKKRRTPEDPKGTKGIKELLTFPESRPIGPQPSKEKRKLSLEISEEMRKARIQGRNPQQALQAFMQNKGLI